MSSLEKKHNFCSCSGLKSLNQTSQSCPLPTNPQLRPELQDITQRLLNQRPILLKGYTLHKKPDLKLDYTLQADGPSASLSYKKRQETCRKIINASYSLRVCKKILGKELWEKVWQICVEEAQVELVLFISMINTILKL